MNIFSLVVIIGLNFVSGDPLKRLPPSKPGKITNSGNGATIQALHGGLLVFVLIFYFVLFEIYKHLH